jgi:hypothetical protein
VRLEKKLANSRVRSRSDNTARSCDIVMNMERNGDLRALV